MDIKLINHGTTGEVLLIGRMDSNTAPQVETILNQVIGRFDNIVLNLTKLEYTSSAGLRIILNLQRAMNKKGGRLTIKGTNKMVMEVFEMTGFASFLNFVD